MAEAESTGTMFQNAFKKNADGDYSLKVTSATGSGTQTPTQVSPPTAAQISSAAASGQANAPATGATIAATASLPAGLYDVETTTHISGTTVAATDAANMTLFVAGSPFVKLITPVQGTSGAAATGVNRCRVLLATPGVIGAVVGASNATAASVYYATVIATRVV